MRFTFPFSSWKWIITLHQPSGPLCPLIRELLLINSLHSGVLTLRSTICPGFYTPESAFWKEEARTAIYQALSVDTPRGSDSKESAYNARDLGSVPGWRRSPGEGNGHPLLYSCLENPVDRGAWWTAVQGVTDSRTRLSDGHFDSHLHVPAPLLAPDTHWCNPPSSNGGCFP